MIDKTTLYSKDAREKIRVWSIWEEDEIIYMEHGTLNGETQITEEEIFEGKGGRDIDEQVESRINSRVNKQIDKGYRKSLAETKKGIRTNGLGYKKPAKCLAFTGGDSNVSYDGLTGIQMKLNGHHANTVNDGGENIMYSNGGKIISTLPEIVEQIKLPVGRVVEGELYYHGVPLQTISSWVGKKQIDTDKIEYVIYDIDLQETYQKRYRILKEMIRGLERVRVLNTAFVSGPFDLEPILKGAIEDKYEGLIFRLEGYGHEDGKRGKGLIKVKPRHFKNFRTDDEFLVVDIVSSRIGAVLVCITEEGKEFRCTVHGTVAYKHKVLKRKTLYIGKHIRAEFESYTKGKVPFQPVALEWREKFEE